MGSIPSFLSSICLIHIYLQCFEQYIRVHSMTRVHYRPKPKILINMTLLSMLVPSIFTPVLCDAAEPWQLGFQDNATPNAEGILELHDTIMFYIIVVLTLVVWMLASTVLNFGTSKSQIAHKYSNHGTLIELIWTITPAFVLVAIAFPSFKLLYLMDNIEGASICFAASSVVSVKNMRSNNTGLVPLGIVGNTANLRYN